MCTMQPLCLLLLLFTAIQAAPFRVMPDPPLTRGSRWVYNEIHQLFKAPPPVPDETPISPLITDNTDNTPRHGIRKRRSVVDFLSDVPFVGHGIGIAHYIQGNTEAGNRAMEKSSRTLAVGLGGAAGFAVGGPLAAVGMGVAAGGAFDNVATAIDSASNGEYKPRGLLKTFTSVGKDLINGEQINTDPIVDSTFDVLFDGLAGGLSKSKHLPRKSKLN